MKYFITVVAVVFLCWSCKKAKNINKESGINKIEIIDTYPKEISAVFKAHGGLKKWQSFTTLSFNKGSEAHTVDLNSRKTAIHAPNYGLGFDGETVWADVDKGANFKANPTFYYNLYFYFYAMPFVLADSGIIYTKVDDLVFENTNYTGYKIAYNANVGNSPEDNYILYFDKETNKMAWLAYTVTFNSKQPSAKYNIIRYANWHNVNGLLLPKEITWYKQDANGTPTEPAGKPVVFTKALLSKAKLAANFFKKPIKN